MARVRTPDKEFTAKEHKERKDKEEDIFEINLTLPVHNAFSPQDQVPEVEKQIVNYHRLRALCHQIVDVALEVAKLQQAAKRKRNKVRSTKG